MDSHPTKERRFIFLYFNRKEAQGLREVVPDHVQYWKRAKVKGYMGGPLGDRTGGLITFLATDLDEAQKIIEQDPFVLGDLVDQMWIKEWVPE